jgi:alpha-glucosidase
MARRKGETWYLGGITNWDSRDLTLDISFLAGKTMTLVTDGHNAEKNAEDYQYKSVKVGSTLNIHMASGGGFAAIVN